MTPLQDPAIQESLKILEEAPLIGTVIGIALLSMGAIFKHFIRRK